MRVRFATKRQRFGAGARIQGARETMRPVQRTQKKNRSGNAAPVKTLPARYGRQLSKPSAKGMSLFATTLNALLVPAVSEPPLALSCSPLVTL